MTHDTCQSSTNVRVLGAGCMYGLWRTLCSGATGACMMAGWERRMPCGAARGAGTCAMRLDGAWSQHPAQVQVSHRSPRAPVVGVREGRGCRRRSGRPVEGRLGTTRALGLRVDSVISYHTTYRLARTRYKRNARKLYANTNHRTAARDAVGEYMAETGARAAGSSRDLAAPFPPWRAEPRAPGSRPRARAHRSRTPRRRTDRERNERKRPNGSRARPTLPTLGTCCSLAPPRARRRPGRATCD